MTDAFRGEGDRVVAADRRSVSSEPPCLHGPGKRPEGGGGGGDHGLGFVALAEEYRGGVRSLGQLAENGMHPVYER